MPLPARIRIGELSRRAGVSPELLRAWETRYGLLHPERTQGGLRLYSERDERRVRRMQELIGAGLSAAEAARLAKLDGERLAHSLPRAADLLLSLQGAFDALDEGAAQAAVDRVLDAYALQPALSEVILPTLRTLGARWADAEVTVAEEHFASNIISGRLLALARGWGEGVGPRAVLACPPGERHELGLLCFGLVLRERGWRIAYFGADTPLGDISDTVAELEPAVIVLAAVQSAGFVRAKSEITALSRRTRVLIGGAGATSRLARTLGAEWLGDDLFRAAGQLTP